MRSEDVGDVVRLERAGDIGVIKIDNPPINAGTRAVRVGLLAAIKEFQEADELGAGVLIGAGRVFMAGSDMRAISAPVLDPILPEVISAIESCPKPIVAAIAGAALGGGYELALGCDGRIALAEAVVGLPECGLGMMPGAGGTQRLPRLTGLPAAIRLVCTSERVEARRAADLGMIDSVAEGPLLDQAIAFVRELGGRKRRVMNMEAPAFDQATLDLAVADALAVAGDRPHIRHAIEAIGWTKSMPGSEALRAERAIFDRLRTGPEAEAMLHLFFAARDSGKIDGVDPRTAHALDRVVIVGEGEVAQALSPSLAGAGRRLVRVPKDSDRGALEASELAACARCGIIVVDAANDPKALPRLLADVAKHAVSDAALLVTGEGQSVAALGDAYGRPGQVCGWRPSGMPGAAGVVEIVRGRATRPEVLATALAVAKAAGQAAVVVGDNVGLVGARIARAAQRGVDQLRAQGVPEAEVRDALMAFGMPSASGEECRRPATAEAHDGRIVSTVLTAIASEAAVARAEGAVRCYDDVDLLLTRAHGFPSHEGGIGLWARRQPPGAMFARLDALAAYSGGCFAVADPDTQWA